ncbi:hypothetical protein AB0N23_28845, partial [Streptomyces sp. NPDC052644]
MDTTSPLPLPADRIPPGTADWRSADARRWLDAVPAAWAHPLWAVLALVLAALWVIAAAPDTVCTPAEPCGTDWPGLCVAAALPLTLYWVVRQPRLALPGLAVLVLGDVVVSGSVASLGEPSMLGFVAASAFTAAGLLHRIGAAARQRALAREAAGPAATSSPTHPGGSGAPSPSTAHTRTCGSARPTPTPDASPSASGDRSRAAHGSAPPAGANSARSRTPGRTSKWCAISSGGHAPPSTTAAASGSPPGTAPEPRTSRAPAALRAASRARGPFPPRTAFRTRAYSSGENTPTRPPAAPAGPAAGTGR